MDLFRDNWRGGGGIRGVEGDTGPHPGEVCGGRSPLVCCSVFAGDVFPDSLPHSGRAIQVAGQGESDSQRAYVFTVNLQFGNGSGLDPVWIRFGARVKGS